MTVRAGEGGSIELIGTCASTDAEPLLQLLLAAPEATIDWRGCRGAHAAVLQVLMAAGPKLLGPAADRRLEEWVRPAIGSPPRARIPAPGGIS